MVSTAGLATSSGTHVCVWRLSDCVCERVLNEPPLPSSSTGVSRVPDGAQQQTLRALASPERTVRPGSAIPLSPTLVRSRTSRSGTGAPPLSPVLSPLMVLRASLPHASSNRTDAPANEACAWAANLAALQL